MKYKRSILKDIKQSIKEYPITLITGARQVGKTTIVNYFAQKHGYNYIALDSSQTIKEAKNDPISFLSKHKPPLVIDEVQKATNLFDEIEHIVNETRRTKGSKVANGMYILTGSQKFELMKNVSESMSGRVGIIEMQPLSLNEINDSTDIPFEVENEKLLENVTNKKTTNNIYDYIIKGFYPGRWEHIDNPIKDFYKNYVKTYLERDVSELINIKDKVKFENFLKILATLTGQELIYNNISKVLGMDTKTIISWTNILIISDIISLLPPYHENSIKKTIIKKQKIYFNDTGLACYLIGIKSSKELLMSSFKGPIFETFIYNEIRKSYLNNNLEPQLYFYRDNNQNEIDMIIKNGINLSLIEIKSGTNYTYNDIKGFKQLENTKFEIKGGCIICNCNDAYRLTSGTYAYPFKVI